MLKALADQLKTLAEKSYGQFRDEIKTRMNGKVTDEQVSALKEFIFLLPPTLKALNHYWNRKLTPPEAKKASGVIISYILEPNDFLPESKHGLFGYLDDAYFVVSTFIRLQDTYPRDWRDKSREEQELENRARELIVAPRVVIPTETAKIDEMVDLLMKGDISEFERLF
jgi:uncharacterized membrane protein YkvA (DUF1232 family)